MKVVYLSSARSSFGSIMAYLRKHYEPSAVLKIRTGLLDAVDLLSKYRGLGQMEPYLEHLGQGHRRMVVGKYKIIYRVEGDRIVVCDFFDARRDPAEMQGG